MTTRLTNSFTTLGAYFLVCLVPACSGIHSTDESGNTPLHNAAWKGKPAVVKELLKAGANIEARTKGKATPLHLAAREGELATVKELLKAGANIEARDKNGNTPLHNAALSVKPAVVKELLKAGANIEARTNNGSTPLMAAVRSISSHNASNVRILLDAGADPKAVSEDNSTALHYINSYGSPDAVRMLLEAGTDVEIVDNSGYTALERAENILRSLSSSPVRIWGDNIRNIRKIINLLLKADQIYQQHEARQAEQQTDQAAALLHAARHGDTATVQTLLGKGVDIETKDNRGRTALYLAATNGHKDTVKALLKAGASTVSLEE